jgi:predicted DNA-binding ArsR family transcriptional regulator
MAKPKNTPEEIEFIRNACVELEDLNNILIAVFGEDDKAREVRENVKALRESIGEPTSSTKH